MSKKMAGSIRPNTEGFAGRINVSNHHSFRGNPWQMQRHVSLYGFYFKLYCEDKPKFCNFAFDVNIIPKAIGTPPKTVSETVISLR